MMQNTISNLREILEPGDPTSVFKYTTLGQFISNVLTLVMTGAGLACLGLFLYGGVMWITAGGDQESLKAAKSRITNAVVGLAITVSAYVIWRLLIRFFGLSSVFPES